MSALSAVGSVGAGLSQAQFQVQYQAAALKEQKQVANTLGAVTLELMRSAMSVKVGGDTAGAQGHDLDVKA